MLERIADEIWQARHDLVTFGVHFPGRMTTIRLPDGALMLISPVPIDDALAARLAELGEVRHIVAPNLFHHLHLRGAIDRYPEARVYGAPGFPAKRKDVRFDEILGNDAPAAWRDVVAQRLVEGAATVNEVAFLHRPSRSLVVTDLVFNFRSWNTWLTGVVLWLVRARGRPAQSRMWRRWTRDRAAAGASVRDILAWDFERIVPAHGDIIDEHAREVAEQVLAWMRAGAGD